MGHLSIETAAKYEWSKLPTRPATVNIGNKLTGFRDRFTIRIMPTTHSVKRRRPGLSAALAVCLNLPHAALAEELLTERQLPLSLALDGARAALDGCLAQNYKVAVTVVDRAGQVRATLRADGANPHLLEGALRKAYTASMLRISTVQMGAVVERSPGANALMAFEHMTSLGGGLPIRIGDDVVGGIGVAGVPVGGAGGAGDEGCARLGLERIVSKLVP